MSSFDDTANRLRERDSAGLYRRRRVVGSAQGRELLVDGQRLLNFCSNDYLGLAGDERVRDALVAGARQWGTGSGAAHLVCGHTAAHHDLEEALAEFTGRPRALLFASGYAANVGTLNALLNNGDHVYEDRLNHASLLDGGLSSGAKFRRYAHRDIADLESKLASADGKPGNRLIASDGTFSMDGTVCDVAGLATTAREHDAWLMIDEAHSLGVSGHQGRGLVGAEEFSTEDVQIVVGTLGKAFGTQGGFIAGSEELIETLIQQARTYIYSTALPAAVACATLVSLRIAVDEEWRREKLTAHTERFRAGAEQLGLQLGDSATPIQPIILGDESTALALSSALEKQGILIAAIRPPTVPKGTSRLRVTLTAAHHADDIERLLQALEQVC